VAGDRSFVHIVARDPAALHRLREHDLDLFRHSATADAGVFRVEGLLSTADAERLRGEGYEVHVVDPAAARSRAHVETATFEEWLASFAEE
jgi:hypothetical protein